MEKIYSEFKAKVFVKGTNEVYNFKFKHSKNFYDDGHYEYVFKYYLSFHESDYDSGHVQ